MKREMIHTVNLRPQKPSGRLRFNIVPFAFLAMWAMTETFPCLAQQPAQPTFPSAADAAQSLFQAVESDNEQAIANILGGPTELTSSRDAGQDKLDREMFVHKYREMRRLSRETNRSVTLYIGAENWPFPIPIVEKNGAWRFDADAGQKEVLYRRIGENELTAIAICHDFASAAKAAESAGGDPMLLHGYYFRELPIRPTSGGFALVAYPAEYRSSGVMTFVVTDSGVVYEKDLGANTSALATAMAAFHKDTTWRPTDD